MTVKLVNTKTNIKLSMPKFLVDDYPITEGKNELPYPLNLLDCYHSVAMIGRAGSGKTSLMISLLTTKKPKLFRKRFQSIYVVMPKASRSSIKNNIFDKNLPEDQLYSELNEIVIDDLIEKVKNNSLEGNKSLIILDDVATYLKNSQYLQQRIKELIDNRRHYHVCLWFSLQTYSSLNLSSRKNISHAFIFKPSKKEAECLLDELFEFTKEQSLEIMDSVFDKQHNYLFLDVYKRKLFKNLEQEIIPETEN